MASEPLKSTSPIERSPEEAAREQLKHALSHLQRAVQQRLKDAATAEAAAQDNTKWQETIDALEAETRSLKSENTRLAESLKSVEDRPIEGVDTSHLTDAINDVAGALDEAIASVEKILKG